MACRRGTTLQFAKRTRGLATKAINFTKLPAWHNLVLRGIANPVSRKGFPGSNPGAGVL